MRIHRVDNTSFGALIRIKSPEQLLAEANQMIKNMPPEYRGLSAGASSVGISSSGSGLVTTGSGSNSLATGFDIVGTAYSAKAVGVDSFGIVPSVSRKISICFDSSNSCIKCRKSDCCRFDIFRDGGINSQTF